MQKLEACLLAQDIKIATFSTGNIKELALE